MRNADFSWWQKHHTLIISLSAIVVFITTYLLILPALTLEKETAEQQGGISVEETAIDAAEETAVDPSEGNTKKLSEESTKASEAGALSYSGKDFDIETSYKKDACLPKDTKLSVSEIKEDSKEYKDYFAQAIKELKKDDADNHGSEISSAYFYDINLSVDGKEVEPLDAVNVTISYDKGISAKDADHVRIIHFVEDKKTGKVTPQLLEKDDTSFTITKEKVKRASFDAESFSVYGVITQPAPESANDLAGYTFKISKDGRYVDSQIVNDQTNKFSKVNSADMAAEWTFEATGTAGVYYVSTMINGQKKYMSLNRRDDNNAHAVLSDAPQAVTVRRNSNGTFTLGFDSNGTRYYLNEFGGWSGNGFAGWNASNDGNNQLTLNTIYPSSSQGGQYIVVVKKDDKYYTVLSDGSLQEVDYIPSSNQVKMDYPLLWNYNNNHIYIDADAVGYSGNQLASSYYYTYLDPSESSGVLTEGANDVRTHQADGPVVDERYRWGSTTIRYDATNHRLYDAQTNKSVGVTYDSEKHQYHLAGNATGDDIAEVFLAVPASVPEPTGGTHNNHAVNHIDISIEGDATVKVPMAYGDYYDANGNVIYTATKQDHFLRFSTDSSEQADDTLSPISITEEDMKKAEIIATAMVNGQRTELDDAFYVSGYSGNDQNVGSTVQVRIEGSFKVANIPYADNADNRSEICQARKANVITYTVSVTKEVTITLKHDGHTLYNNNGEAMTIKVPVTMSASFDYWDERNECPAVHVGLNPNNDFDQAWKDGKILNEGATMSGMDFKLGSTKNDQQVDVPAIEISKYIQTPDGDLIETATPHKISIGIYQKDKATGDENKVIGQGVQTPLTNAETYSLINNVGFPDAAEHTKDITVGTGGMGATYDYDVSNGMIYIKEDEGSVEQKITGIDGRTYRYIKTQSETEYVWRQNGDEEKVHLTDSLSSVPEVLGPYKGINGSDETNTFLEFSIYNIYKPVYPVQIAKVDAGNTSLPLAGAEFDLYGPFKEVRTTNDNNTDTGRKVGTPFHVTTPENGIVSLGELTDKYYYLYETKSPDGYDTPTEPIVITVDSQNSNGQVVSYEQAGNSASAGDGRSYHTTDGDGNPIDEPYYQLMITNTSGVELPHTGGMGTRLIYAAGAIFLIGGAVLLMVRRRRYA